MEKINRRSFFTALGVLPVTAPVLLKAATTATADYGGDEDERAVSAMIDKLERRHRPDWFNIGDPARPKLWSHRWFGTKVFLNGKEMKFVYYANQKTGVVKTYWIEGLSSEGEVAKCVCAGWNSNPRILHRSEDFPGREIECVPGDVLRETLHGKVVIAWPSGLSEAEVYLEHIGIQSRNNIDRMMIESMYRWEPPKLVG